MRQTLHLHSFADGLATWLPTGLAGAIGMIRNWMFTAFYVSSELWGEVFQNRTTERDHLTAT